MALFAVFLCLTLAPGARAQEDANVARLTELARKIHDRIPVQAKPDGDWTAAMDLLIDEAVRLRSADPKVADTEIEKRMDRYAKALKSLETANDLGAPTAFTLDTDRAGDLQAIAVTLGHASRLRLVRVSARKTEEIPAVLQWRVDWAQEPRFTRDGSLMMLCTAIQDAGYRTAFRIDGLFQEAGSWRVRKTLQRMDTLDWGGAQLVGDRLKVQSLDPPASFFTASADALFRRTDDYRVVHGDLKLVRAAPMDREFRAIDRWILQARKAPASDKAHALIRATFAQQTMLNNHKLTKLSRSVTRVELTFDTVALTFDVTGRSDKMLVRLASAKNLPAPPR